MGGVRFGGVRFGGEGCMVGSWLLKRLLSGLKGHSGVSAVSSSGRGRRQVRGQSNGQPCCP